MPPPWSGERTATIRPVGQPATAPQCEHLNAPASRARRWRITAAAVAALSCNISVNVAAAVSPRSRPAAGVAERVTPGPWGRVELTRIALEPPRELVSALPAAEPSRWVFPGKDRQSVLAMLRSAQLTPAEVDGCDRRGRWTMTAKGVTLEPPSEVVFSLTPDSRERLYRSLAAASPENIHQRNPIAISADVAAAIDRAHLTPMTVDRFRRVLYGKGTWRLFSDLPALLTTCPTPAEKVRLLMAVLRSESYLVRLYVDDTTDIDALVAYWGAHGRAETIRPLLESVARLPGEASIDVRGLLPAWQSGRINRYPRRSDPVEPRADCFWTALNFFADQPLPPLHDPNGVLAELKTRYRPVAGQPTFGDLVVLLNEAGAPVHAAVHVAENLVLTKNGAGILRPWTYMRLPDVVALYTSINGKLTAVHVTEVQPRPAERTAGGRDAAAGP